MMDLKVVLLIHFLFAASKCIQRSENETEHPRALGIIGGQPANIKEFPFLVSLHYRHSRTRNGHVCCGFLVTPSWVITAAHCLLRKRGSLQVLPTQFFYLLASTADVVNRDDNYQKRTVKSFIPHPYFSWSLIYHDIGLIEASSPFKYNGHISLAVLPRPDWKFHLDSWITCSVAGWGVTNKNEPQSLSNKLMSVTLDVAPKEVCEKGIGGSSFENPGGSICTYSVNGTKDACKGDSGSALVCNHPEMKGNVLLPDLTSDWAINGWNVDQWRRGIALGIVSWSWECAHNGVPAVFTDVRQYRDWVRCTVLSASSSANAPPVFFIALLPTLLKLALN